MSEDVRKHLRTQGRYSDKRQKVSPPVKEPSEKKLHKRNSNGNKEISTSATDESLSSSKITDSPIYEENSDYTFRQLDTIKKPIEIAGRGKHILSETKNGVSMILYEPHFLHDDEGWDYYDRLYNVINWHSKNIVIHGIEYPQPRLVAWYGPLPYTYSGSTLEPAEMPEPVLRIKQKVEQYLKATGVDVKFNSVLLNLYRNGKDSVAWHSDDELSMGISPTIASVSLGETRKFEMRFKFNHCEDENPSDQTNDIDDMYFLRLIHGSLAVMSGCMQDDWEHRVPKEYHDKHGRINLTFRTVYALEKIPENVPVRDIKTEPVAEYSLNKSSSCEINYDEENFPPLKSDSHSYSNIKQNIPEKNQYPNSRENVSFRKQDSATFDSNQDDYNDANSNIHTYENSCANNHNCVIQNVALGSIGSHIEVSVNLELNVSEKKDLDRKEHPIEGHNDKAIFSANQESNFSEKNRLEKFSNIDTISSVNQNNMDKKEYSRNLHNEANSSVNDSQENDFDKKDAAEENFVPKQQHSIKHHYIDTDSPISSSQNYFVKKDLPKKIEYSEAGSTENTTQKHNTNKKESPNKSYYFNPNSSTSINKENNLDIKGPPKAHYREITNVTQQQNLNEKKPPRFSQLNVDAKEFVPVNLPNYDKFDLEDLIHYKMALMSGDQLKGFAYSLRDKVQDRLYHDFQRYDRDELEFLCMLTDGTQTDKNQRLISGRLCKTVSSIFDRNQRPFDGNSRRSFDGPRSGYQTHYPDKGKKHQNHGRRY